jgi:hypothetical protein
MKARFLLVDPQDQSLSSTDRCGTATPQIVPGIADVRFKVTLFRGALGHRSIIQGEYVQKSWTESEVSRSTSWRSDDEPIGSVLEV